MSNKPAAFDELAKHIAAKAMEKETPFTDKVDALKVLTAYHVARNKERKGTSFDDDGDEPSIANLAAHINRANTENTNGTPVRSGSGRRSGNKDPGAN